MKIRIVKMRNGKVETLHKQVVKVNGGAEFLKNQRGILQGWDFERITIMFGTPYGNSSYIRNSKNADAGTVSQHKIGDCMVTSGVLSPGMMELDEKDYVCILEEGEMGVDLYRDGFVISTGKTVTSIFGEMGDGYIASLRRTRTGTKLTRATISSARCFKTKRALLNFLKKYQSSLEYFATEYGYVFGVEFASKMYEEEYDNKKDEKVDVELAEVFGEINAGSYDDVEADVDMNAHPEEEAIERMRQMNIMPKVVNDFRHGKLMFSEFGGILYDLNEDAQKAVEKVSAYGLPYHVVRTQTEIGDMYAVLYVSKEPEEWAFERYNKKDDTVYALVYNATHDFVEGGSILVKPANGGLMRVG